MTMKIFVPRRISSGSAQRGLARFSRSYGSATSTFTGDNSSDASRYLTSSLSEASYPTARMDDDELDIRHFGYRTVFPMQGRRYSSSGVGSSFGSSSMMDEYSTIMASPSPVSASSLWKDHDDYMRRVPSVMPVHDRVTDIQASQAEWDDMITKENMMLAPPHLECMKEDPYLDRYEAFDATLRQLHLHDIVPSAEALDQEVNIHHRDVDMNKD